MLIKIIMLSKRFPVAQGLKIAGFLYIRNNDRRYWLGGNPHSPKHFATILFWYPRMAAISQSTTVTASHSSQHASRIVLQLWEAPTADQPNNRLIDISFLRLVYIPSGNPSTSIVEVQHLSLQQARFSREAAIWSIPFSFNSLTCFCSCGHRLQ